MKKIWAIEISIIVCTYIETNTCTGVMILFSLRQLIAEIITITVLECLCTFLKCISVVSGKPESTARSKASLPSYLLYLARGYECGGGGTGVLGQVFGQHLTLHCWSAVSDRSSPDYWVMTTFHLSRCTCVTLYCHLALPPPTTTLLRHVVQIEILGRPWCT